MPTATLNEGLQWLATLGLATASTVVTGAIIKAIQDARRAALPNAAKEYISYGVPFLLVALAYGGQLWFGYLLFDADTAFAYFWHAGFVAFGSQVVYTMYKSAQPPVAVVTTTVIPLAPGETAVSALDSPPPVVPPDTGPTPYGPPPSPGGYGAPPPGFPDEGRHG